MIKDVWAFLEATFPLISFVSVVSWALSLVTIDSKVDEKARARGGNVLGFDVPPEGIILIHLSVAFTSSIDYTAVNKISENLLAVLIDKAKDNGLYHPFIDLNHAGAKQHVFAGYEVANHKFLKTTAKKYDPNGVFQKLASGPFKL